jgi:hypothetical protein
LIDEPLELLPVNEPFQTQQDIRNAMTNADAIRARESQIASAQSAFIPYSNLLLQWENERERIDAQNDAAQQAAIESRNQRISAIQSEINRLESL